MGNHFVRIVAALAYSGQNIGHAEREATARIDAVAEAAEKECGLAADLASVEGVKSEKSATKEQRAAAVRLRVYFETRSKIEARDLERRTPDAPPPLIVIDEIADDAAPAPIEPAKIPEPEPEPLQVLEIPSSWPDPEPEPEPVEAPPEPAAPEVLEIVDATPEAPEIVPEAPAPEAPGPE